MYTSLVSTSKSHAWLCLPSMWIHPKRMEAILLLILYFQNWIWVLLSLKLITGRIVLINNKPLWTDFLCLCTTFNSFRISCPDIATSNFSTWNVPIKNVFCVIYFENAKRSSVQHECSEAQQLGDKKQFRVTFTTRFAASLQPSVYRPSDQC